MHKITFYLCLFIAVISSLIGCNKKNDFLITVNQYVHHPNLEKTYKGIEDVVNKWAQDNGKKVSFDLQIANGDVSTATQIANQQVLKNPDIMLALATPSAQACQRATNKIPIIFGAITDPVKAGLVTSLTKPGANITGSSDEWPYEKQFSFLRDILPGTKKIGILLNPGESNTEASMKIIREITKKYNFEIIEAPVSNTSEIYSAANSLVGRCDIFFAPADNTVLSGLDAFVKVARTNKIPIFVGDEGSVEKGGIATFGIDYYELGKETGKQIIQVLEGKKTGEIPVIIGSAGKLIINKEAMNYFKIDIPKELQNQAEFK